MTSLIDRCVTEVIKHIPQHLDDIQTLPSNLKDKLLQLMAKRGIITDENIKKILHCKVQSLDLSECDLSDAGLSEVTSCRHLRSLHLNAGKRDQITVTSEALDLVFKHCIYLQAVYLRRCTNVSDSVIITLAMHCPNLVELNVGGCSLITDAALQALGGCSAKLECIQFSKTEVTDVGVLKLASGLCQPVLKEIVMNGCRHLTDYAVEIIVTYCANLSILVFHDCPKMTDYSRQIVGPHSKVKQIMWTVY